MAGLLRWIRKSVVTDNYQLVNRIGHGDGGPNNVEYHYDIAEIINKLAENNLISSPAIQVYQMDDNSVVTADGPGVTIERTNGQITLTVPDIVNIMSFRIHGDASELSSGNMTIIISGGRGAGTMYNSSDADARYPFLYRNSRPPALLGGSVAQMPHDSRTGFYSVEHTLISDDMAGRTISTMRNISGEWEIIGQL